jgi:hypothetical protein
MKQQSHGDDIEDCVATRINMRQISTAITMEYAKLLQDIR